MIAKSNNLKYGKEYKFRIYEEIGMSKGEYSDIKTFYYSEKPEKPAVPGKINIIKLESYSSSSLTVIWEESSDNEGLSHLSYGIRNNDNSKIGNNF